MKDGRRVWTLSSSPTRRYIMQAWHVLDHWSSLNFHSIVAQSSHLTRRSISGALLTSHDTSRGRGIVRSLQGCCSRLLPGAGSCVTGRYRVGAATDSLQSSTGRVSTWTRRVARRPCPAPPGMTRSPTLDDRTRVGRSPGLYFFSRMRS